MAYPFSTDLGRLGEDGMSPELKEFYSRILLSTAEENFVYMRYGMKVPIPARSGKCVEVRRFENIKCAEGSYILTEGTVPEAIVATISNVECTLSQYGAYSRISDMLEVQGFDPIIENFADRYGYHMQEALDNIVRDIVDAGTSIQYAGDANCVGTSSREVGSHQPVGSGMYMDSAEVLEAVRTLKRNNARPVKSEGKYVCILHPDNWHDLMTDPDITKNYEQALPRGGDNPLFTGVLGDWMGVRFVETTNLGISASNGMSGADVYEVVVLGDEAYMTTDLDAMQARLIVHPRGTGGHTDPLEQYSTIGWKAALGAKILNQDWLVVIKCASSKASAA